MELINNICILLLVYVGGGGGGGGGGRRDLGQARNELVRETPISIMKRFFL